MQVVNDVKKAVFKSNPRARARAPSHATRPPAAAAAAASPTPIICGICRHTLRAATTRKKRPNGTHRQTNAAAVQLALALRMRP